MDPIFRSADVAVVGAGTTGAAVAGLCARRGMDVVVVDRQSCAQAGAGWVNGVPADAFDRAGIDRPTSPELVSGGGDFHLIAGWGPERVVVVDPALMEVDMRLLVGRLQRRARQAGAEFIGQVRARRAVPAGLETSRGTVLARWVIDASGLAGARLIDQPAPPAADLCSAAQQIRRVVDGAAARRFVANHGGRPGDTLCFSGVEGGYSILNVRVDGDRVALLTGSIPAAGHRSGRQMVADFARRTGWVGPSISGGSRAIPLRRPYRQLYRGHVGAVGDAACQVFAAHGSGIGPGLVAARILADALADGHGLPDYQRRWHRQYGGLFGAYAVFRRFAQTLDPADIARMMSAGLMDADLAAQGLLQQVPAASLSMLADKIGAAMRAPDLAARLIPVGARMAANLAYPNLFGARLAR